MRHHNHNRKFGRERNQRRAFLRSLAVNLITHGQIRTTTARAKELRPLVEKLVTRARVGNLFARRLLLARLGRLEAVQKLVTDIAPRYARRAGGYTRITKLPTRLSDGSSRALIEFV
ncbi:MAG TPA: 50S ribosomal protein L17 [Candidatus Paceibacterota bacterium]